MIINFEIFEQIENTPEVGDYVICYEPSVGEPIIDELNNFLLNNIGKLVEIRSIHGAPYVVEYENIPERIDHWFHDLKLNCRDMRKSEVIHWSKNKEDLIPFIQLNKYNL